MKSKLLLFSERWCTCTFLALSVITLFSCNQEKNETQQKPNIVLILADDMGYSDIGAYGGEIETPNLDQLADEGIQFTQFYNTAKCVETRTQILTGLYHLQSDNMSREDNNVTIAEVLGQEGYETILSGKWHLGNWREEEDIPTQRGFDHFFGFLGGAINFFTGEDWGSGENYMRKGTEEYNVPEDFYSTDNFTDYAIDRVDEATEKENPFFLYLAHNAPHFPLHAPQEDIEKYKGRYSIGWDSLRRARYQRMQEMGLIKPEWELSKRDTIVPPWNSLSEEQKKEEQLLMATYAGMVDRLDQQIGRLMNHLEEKGEAENTMVVFLSDNGGCPFDHNRPPYHDPGPAKSGRTYDAEWANASNTPFRLYKQWIHEGGISTPMIVKWPEKIEGGRVTRAKGQITDLMPTFLEAAGVQYPETFKGNQILPKEGESIMPVLKGNADSYRDTLYWDYRGSRAIRIDNWKLVGERGLGWELYDLEKDRSETNNLIEKYPERASEMAEAYNAWAKRVGARTNEEAKNMDVNTQDRYLYESEKMEAAQ